MTALEIVLIIILWVIIGVWISYKRNWYQHKHYLEDRHENIFTNILLSPVCLIIVLFKYFIKSKWQ